jgi:DNA uptake protein ComE-like DNA-binding protein
MTRLRAWIRSYFGFSRTETNAFLVLLPLMLLLIFAEPLYRYWFVRQPQDFARETAALDSLMATWKWDSKDSLAMKAPIEELFPFDPNAASRQDFTKLGFSNAVANRIMHYRQKGGRFLVKKDLLKIYGMDSAMYKKVFAYIDLPDKILKQRPAEKIAASEKAPFEKFDLNTADTSQLIKIYGIGPKLSQRIVVYRNKLGGFIASYQLREVYGLDSGAIHELFKKSLIRENFEPTRIDINRASEQELGVHPYIRYRLAKAITAYRFQHGTYRSVDDLRKVALVDDATFQKIKPYLSANP